MARFIYLVLKEMLNDKVIENFDVSLKLNDGSIVKSIDETSKISFDCLKSMQEFKIDQKLANDKLNSAIKQQ